MNDAIDKPSSSCDEWVRALRTGLQLIPLGIGSALDVQIFDRMAARDHERINAFVESLAGKIESLCAEQADFVKLEYLDTDEFRFILREVFTSAAREHREEKINAYRAVLINAMHEDPRVEFDRKAFFVEILDRLNPDDLRILKHFYDGRTTAGARLRETLQETWASHGARHDEVKKSYVQARVDAMAAYGLLLPGPVPIKL